MCFNRDMHHDMEFPNGGIWLHIIGALLIFFLGMRFGFRRAPFPMLAYRLMRMLIRG